VARLYPAASPQGSPFHYKQLPQSLAPLWAPQSTTPLNINRGARNYRFSSGCFPTVCSGLFPCTQHGLVSGRSVGHAEADFVPFPDGQRSCDYCCLKRSLLSCVAIVNVSIVQDTPASPCATIIYSANPMTLSCLVRWRTPRRTVRFLASISPHLGTPTCRA
jgi:hypothetical protein